MAALGARPTALTARPPHDDPSASRQGVSQMVPTLAGRIQTRLALLAVVGGIVTAIIVPVLPVPASASLGDTYRNAFLILATVAVLGVGWEFIYHFLMQ